MFRNEKKIDIITKTGHIILSDYDDYIIRNVANSNTNIRFLFAKHHLQKNCENTTALNKTSKRLQNIMNMENPKSAGRIQYGIYETHYQSFVYIFGNSEEDELVYLRPDLLSSKGSKLPLIKSNNPNDEFFKMCRSHFDEMWINAKEKYELVPNGRKKKITQNK